MDYIARNLKHYQEQLAHAQLKNAEFIMGEGDENPFGHNPAIYLNIAEPRKSAAYLQSLKWLGLMDNAGQFNQGITYHDDDAGNVIRFDRQGIQALIEAKVDKRLVNTVADILKIPRPVHHTKTATRGNF
jgi:hypothetical protein